MYLHIIFAAILLFFIYRWHITTCEEAARAGEKVGHCPGNN